MKKHELKSAIKKIVREVINESQQLSQKIRLDIDPTNKNSFVVKYLDQPVGTLTSTTPFDRGNDAYGVYTDTVPDNTEFVFKATDPRFKRLDNTTSKLKKHLVDFMRLVTLRIEKGI